MPDGHLSMQLLFKKYFYVTVEISEKQERQLVLLDEEHVLQGKVQVKLGIKPF